MGSESIGAASKYTVKTIREIEYYKSDKSRKFSEIINTPEYLYEEQALKNEIITSMTLFHSDILIPAYTTRITHTYCFLSNPQLRKKNKVILIEFGGYLGFHETIKEAPHYPQRDGYRYIFTDGYFDNGYDCLAVVHNKIPFYKILEHFNSQNWTRYSYHLTNHNCQSFIKELIILLEAELILETIPLRCSNISYKLTKNGIYEIPTPLIEGFVNVLEKKGQNFSFISKFEAKFELFEHNLLRLCVSNEKKGFALICFHKYPERDSVRKDFKIYYKDFIRFYEEQERLGNEMASCFKPFYLSFKNKQNDSKYDFY